MLTSSPNLPRPSAAQIDKLLRLLNAKLGPSKYLTGAESCEAYSRDESEAPGVVPDAVVLAKSREDILAALSVARDAGVPITPRGGSRPTFTSDK